jgi:hypothetical protein
MSFLTEVLVWVLFVIVAALVVAVFVMCVAAVVKECSRMFRRPSPPEVQMEDPVKWVRAVVVANPDNTCVWGTDEA